jgi:ubiquinone/menaquinone biosynthesis C-methylase UbiE
MIRQAQLRRRVTLVRADAKAMPFPAVSYETIIYPTGVIDFTADEGEIRSMLAEGRRVLRESGKVFVAFYRASAAQTEFLETVSLIHEHSLAFRESLEVYLMNPVQMTRWVARRAGRGRLHAILAVLRVAVRCTMQERRNTRRMQRVFRRMNNPRALIDAAPERLPYRSEREIQNLFKRLEISIKQLTSFGTCRVVRI